MQRGRIGYEKRPALKLEKRPALKLGTWNVRTMLTGISEDLQDASDSGKTAVINNELMRLNVDIATIQETRLADSGVLIEGERLHILLAGEELGRVRIE